MLKEGDYVSRYSYNNDIVFVIVKIEDNNYILKGANERLVADAPIEDLKKEEGRGEEFAARKPSLAHTADRLHPCRFFQVSMPRAFPAHGANSPVRGIVRGYVERPLPLPWC